MVWYRTTSATGILHLCERKDKATTIAQSVLFPEFRGSVAFFALVHANKTIEQMGDGEIKINVDMDGSIVNEFKGGGNSVGDVHTDIALMNDQGEDLKREI